MSSNAASCFTILKINKRQENTAKRKKYIYVCIYIRILWNSQRAGTHKRCVYVIMCCVLRCACLRFHSLQFFFLFFLCSLPFFLSKIFRHNPPSLSLSPSSPLFVFYLPTYVPFCLELQIACKMSAVHSLLAFNLQTANRKVTHTHTHPECVCLCADSFFISHNKWNENIQLKMHCERNLMRKWNKLANVSCQRLVQDRWQYNLYL